MGLLSWMSRSAAVDPEVRAEIWRLGSRHLGEPLAGARKELAADGLSPERVALLRACIRRLESGSRHA